MEYFQGFGSGASRVSFDNYLSFTPLRVEQQRYLCNVYSVLALGAGATAVGTQMPGLGFAGSLVSSIVIMGCVWYIASTKGAGQCKSLTDVFKSDQHMKRFGAFTLMTLLMGVSLGPFISLATFMNPAIVTTAILTTGISFVCLSLAAIFCRDRRYLYLGGTALTVLSYLTLAGILNAFFRVQLINSLILYAGLAVYLVLVLRDTQAVIVEFDRGMQDVIHHAVAFYADIIGIFIRILRVLMEKESRKREEDRRQKRNN